MKKFITLFVSASLMLTTTVKSQNTTVKVLTPKQQAERTIQELQVPLLLTDIQKTQLYKLLVTSNITIDSLRIAAANPTLIKTQYQLKDQAIADLLTPEQLTKYQAWRMQRMAKMKAN